MRSRPKAYFLSVGGVCTWVNMVQAKCLIGLKGEDFLSVGGVFTQVNMVKAKCLTGLKGEEARSEKPPPRSVSQPQCPNAWTDAL